MTSKEALETSAALPEAPNVSSESRPALTLGRFGVTILNLTKLEAAELLRGWIDGFDGRPRAAFIVNAHTLNLAWEDPVYRRVLSSADAVFADGTGVRLAARFCGVSLRDNLVGTDLVPAFMDTYPGRYRYFLLGGQPGKSARAAEWLRNNRPGVLIAGHHHGFIGQSEHTSVIDQINASGADLLLVAMGNPVQERWIHDALPALRVPVSIGVGGLFEYWAEHLQRAPLWVRRIGFEWCTILLQQPHKWRRYLLGNPKFVARALINAKEHARGRRGGGQ